MSNGCSSSPFVPRMCCVLACALLMAFQVAAAQQPLVVRDIRIEGLQRISEGTVFNYLPLNIGDTLDEKRVQEAMRAVYLTGFFRDVEMIAFLRWLPRLNPGDHVMFDGFGDGTYYDVLVVAL